MMLLSFLPPLGLHPLTPLLPLPLLPLLLPLPSRSAGREPQHFNQPLCERTERNMHFVSFAAGAVNIYLRRYNFMSFIFTARAFF